MPNLPDFWAGIKHPKALARQISHNKTLPKCFFWSFCAKIRWTKWAATRTPKTTRIQICSPHQTTELWVVSKIWVQIPRQFQLTITQIIRVCMGRDFWVPNNSSHPNLQWQEPQMCSRMAVWHHRLFKRTMDLNPGSLSLPKDQQRPWRKPSINSRIWTRHKLRFRRQKTRNMNLQMWWANKMRVVKITRQILTKFSRIWTTTSKWSTSLNQEHQINNHYSRMGLTSLRFQGQESCNKLRMIILRV